MAQSSSRPLFEAICNPLGNRPQSAGLQGDSGVPSSDMVDPGVALHAGDRWFRVPSLRFRPLDAAPARASSLLAITDQETGGDPGKLLRFVRLDTAGVRRPGVQQERNSAVPRGGRVVS